MNQEEITQYLTSIKHILGNQTTMDIRLLEEEYKEFTQEDLTILKDDSLKARDLEYYAFAIDEGICYSRLYRDSYTGYDNLGRESSFKEILEGNKKELRKHVQSYINNKRFVRLTGVNNGYITYFFPEELFVIQFYDDLKYKE